MPTSTQWRINFTANNGGTGTEIAEIQFRTQVGAPLEFPGTSGVSASANTSSMLYAIDSWDFNTWFVYPSTTAQWAYDYGATSMAIKSYVIQAGGSSGSIGDPADKAIKDWTLEYWDGAAWQVADTRTNVTGWINYECREFTVGVPGYVVRPGMFHEASDQWRMVITANGGDPQIKLKTLSLRRKVGSSTTAVGWNYPLASSVTVTSDDTGSSKDNIFNNSTSNYWTTVSGVTAATITAQFQWSVAIRQYGWTYFSSASTPRDFTLEYYDYSTSTWKVADTQTGQTGGVTYTITNDLTSQTNDGDITLPALDLFGSDTYPPDIQLEKRTLSGSITQSPAYFGAVNLGNRDNLDPAYNATPHTLAGTSFTSAAYTGAIVLPLLDMDASLEGPLPLPERTLSATGFAGNVGDGKLTLPDYALQGGFEDPRTIPLRTLDAAAFNGSVADADLDLPDLLLAGSLEGPLPLPELTVDGVGLAGTVADGVLMLAGRDADATLQPEAELILPQVTLDASGLAGRVGQGGITLAKPTLTAIGWQDGTASADLTLPALTMAGGVVSDILANGDVTLGRLTLAATGAAGQFLQATITLPLLSAAGSAYSDTEATATLILPLWQLDATAFSTASDLAPVTYTALAVNTRTKAVTTHTRMPFNSFATFQGVALAASATGLYFLRGDSDAGTPIDALLRSGQADMDSEQLKRVLGGYVGYRADGAMDLTLITDEHHEHVYRLEPRQDGDVLHPTRVKTGRGVDGRYWQWQLENRDGQDFALDSLAFDATVLKRRV